ncbi:carbohydrate ABC transporter permease [Cohnella thailandensis]|uniref:carbohydrate ABC transporter permease n=1 Tax=Cohnella thailandensis TaxID=557557 RepID=UPI001AE3FDF3|nr:raffinose/stachyose/melibiose transport system permease protein [Cohnella thailandensis]
MLRSKRTLQSLKYVLLALYSVTTIFPFLWVFLSSFKTNSEIYSSPFALPKTWQFENYSKAWTSGNIGTNFFNSFYITIVSVALILLFGAMASYILARVYPSLALYTFFGLGIMIPGQTILIPTFSILKELHLVNNHTGLILMYVVSSLSLTIFVLVSFMKTLPKELEEAAIVDGAGRYRTFFSIILPLSTPGLATVGILAVLSVWNEYLFAYVLISDPVLKTLTQGIYGMKGEYMTDYGPMTAGLAITMIPVVILYIIFQNKVVAGMTAGAVKG